MKQILTIFIFLILLISSNKVSSQNYYEGIYSNLQDEIYYPQINDCLENNKMDTLLIIGESAFDYYYKKDETNRAIYLYAISFYFPTGSGLAEKTIPKLNAKIDFLKTKIDTINVHYATLLHIKAFGLTRLMKLNKAKPVFDNAINIYEKANTPTMHLMNAYKSAGFLNIYLYENETGYNYTNKALNILESDKYENKSKGYIIQKNDDKAFLYMSFAALMKQTQQNELALYFYKKSLYIFSEVIDSKENTIVVLNNMANICLETKKNKLALFYVNKADSLINKYNFTNKLILTYNSILFNKTRALEMQENYTEANKTLTKLDVFMKIHFPKEEPMISEIYLGKGDIFYKTNELDSALFYYTKTKSQNPIHEDVNISIAKLYAKKNNFAKAIEFTKMDMDLILNNKNIDKEKPNSQDFTNNFHGFKTTNLLAEYYLNLYKKNEQNEFLQNSLFYFNLSDTLIISHTKSTIVGEKDLILSDDYHNFASQAIEANYIAFNIENKPIFLDNILKFTNQASAFKLNSEVNKIETNVEQIQVSQKIRNLENKLLALEKNPNESETETTETELFKTRKLAFELSFKNQSAKKIDTKNIFTKINISDIQTNLFENEAIITYHLSETKLYSLFISKNEIKINFVEIDETFNNLLIKYYKNLKTGSSVINSGTKLYAYLIKPFENELNTINKLVIIPDNELSRIPFEALVYNENGVDKFLIEKLAISYNYSSFLWIKSRKHPKNRENISFLGFAPVFSDKKEISSENPINNNEQLREEYREITENKHLKPLIYSEEEVLEIQKMFSDKNKKATVFTHENASEQNLKEQINSSTIIHIATHGYSSNETPELSGLFFAQISDNKNISITNDGFIYLGELYLLQTEAELVVLSACKTGAGKIANGEGVLALPRAFIFIRVPNIIASLWKIHDEKTKFLMVYFYSYILNGKTYSEALRLAKLKQIENGVLPINWSSIILIGE